MNLKLVLSKTKDFILIVGFIIIFKSIFGDENTLIGVTTITAMLLFLGKDLTLEPIKNTTGLIVFNVLLGIFAYYAQINMYLGIILNFIAIFVTTFSLSYNLKSPGYIPFTLQYLFMLATPVTADKLPMRLASLVVGAIAIMVTQLIANRNRINKYGNKILRGVCVLLLNKIRAIQSDSNYDELDKQIITSIYSFKKIVYEKRKRNFYLTEEGRIKLNLALSLNKINLLLNDVKEINRYEEVLEDVVIAVDNIKIWFEDEKNLDQLDKFFKCFYEKYDGYDDNNSQVLKLLNIISFINKSLSELKGLEKRQYDKIKNKEQVPEKFKWFYIYKNNFSCYSLRFSFAFRYALGVTIGAFIADYFALAEGRWIFFTISSLSQPQYEMSKQKGKDRIFATVIGTLIIALIFGIIRDTTLRSLVIMGAGYVGSYLNSYRYNMICVTVSAVGSASLLGGTNVLSVTRVAYVVIGMIIAILLAKFVFPYKAEDSNKDLITMYKNTIHEMLKEISELLRGKRHDDSIKNLILASSLIEDKLITNNSLETNSELDLLIEEGRLLSLNIYELYEWIKENEIDKQNLNKIINEIRELETGIRNGINEEELIAELRETHGIKDRITISNIIEIFVGLNRISNITLGVRG